MLRHLTIRNLALVDEADISFGEGLNVITGETGAGKSLLMGALRLLAGERADRSLIRSGERACSVTAEFRLPDSAAVDAVLEAAGLPPCEEGQLVLRRTVTASGGRILVNDEPATLRLLRSLGRLLADFHGPYDHQSLLDPAAQRDILDAYAEADAERADWDARYAAWRDLRRREAELRAVDDEDLRRRIEFLEYRIEEIENAGISPEEEASVRAEHETAANACEILEACSALAALLTESEESALDRIAAARRAAERLQPLLPAAEEWIAELDEAATRIRETARAAESAAADIDAGPERLQWLEERLALYESLERKYGGTVEEILAAADAWREELETLRGRDRQLAEIETRIRAAYRELLAAGETLRARRRRAAERLAEAVTRELTDIGFEHGRFTVELHPADPSPAGIDAVEFGFAPNPGEPVRPLRAIASSGEISRVMLALKTVLARHDRIPVLVFDEIDANIGGEIGTAVGRKLRRVAERHQVLCITHLPQVAAFGAHHIAVSKEVRDGRTYTRVRLLDPSERPDEISRMLGGLTPVTLRHARELLSRT